MSTTKLELKATVTSRGEANPFLSQPGDAVLVDRGGPRWLVLSCPCGCGELFPINLDPRSGKAWRLYKSKAKLSVFPSVWRDTGCLSHYIIWRGRIYLFDHQSYSEEEAEIPLVEVASLTNEVKRLLSADAWIPFSELGAQLGAIPWDILDICRKLVKVGYAEEGAGLLSGNFRRRRI